MERRVVKLDVWIFYANPPESTLKEGVDYRYDREGGIERLCYGVVCEGKYTAEVARHLRRQALLEKKPRACICGRIQAKDVIAGVECSEAGFSYPPWPSSIEVLTLLYMAYVARLVEEGRLDLRRIARTFETGSCKLIHEAWWKLCEELVGRKGLRLSTAVPVNTNVVEAFASLVPGSRGRLAFRRARCLFGCKGSVTYIVEVPREIADEENIRVYSRLVIEASRRLRDEMGLNTLHPTEGGLWARLGVGTWPLSTIPGLAYYSGLVSISVASAFFDGLRRCGFARLWPPRTIDVIVAPDGKLYEPGWVRMEVRELA